MTTIRQQLVQAQAENAELKAALGISQTANDGLSEALDAANLANGILTTENFRLTTSNELLETQLFEQTNRNGELQRDLDGISEAFHALKAQFHEVQAEMLDYAQEAATREEQRRAANRPRPRTAVELLEAHYNATNKELIVGDFKAVVENAIQTGESIIILNEKGERSLTIQGHKLPKAALETLQRKLVIRQPDEV